MVWTGEMPAGKWTKAGLFEGKWGGAHAHQRGSKGCRRCIDKAPEGIWCKVELTTGGPNEQADPSQSCLHN